MPHLKFQERFYQDVRDIWRHIAEDHVGSADAWVQALDRKLELLASQPHMGKPHPYLNAGYRVHPFGSYSIIYKPIKDGIQAVRILHGARLFLRAWNS
ncbi:MAG: type II toxin-antitoxin system RelE/ParE family toxin [Magnetococcales bacterium]|nr:type II toxin-antitoxin system RelE/ParE family toxin [Magnetococcales bacterium]